MAELVCAVGLQSGQLTLDRDALGSYELGSGGEGPGALASAVYSLTLPPVSY